MVEKGNAEAFGRAGVVAADVVENDLQVKYHLSHNEHTVTIRVEAVALRDGVPVGRQHKILAAQRADQQQQTRARQVKIGQHGAGEAEFEARIDEQVRLTAGSA